MLSQNILNLIPDLFQLRLPGKMYRSIKTRTNSSFYYVAIRALYDT